jgi:hypothetical protein
VTARRIDQDLAVTAARLLPSPVTRELRTRYRELGHMLRSAGLAATYAFIAAKSSEVGETGLADAYRQAGKGLLKRLTDAELLTGEEPSAAEVLTWLGEMSPFEYARASAEAQALTSWLARLADAMYDPSDQGNTSQSAEETADAGEAASAGAGP